MGGVRWGEDWHPNCRCVIVPVEVPMPPLAISEESKARVARLLREQPAWDRYFKEAQDADGK